MREILFRGKRVDNGEWVEGFYVIIAGENHCIFTGRLDITQGSIGYEYFKVDHETVGQYTGLTDKNEVKIFEGDILDASAYEIEGYGIVKFGEHKSGDMSNDYPCGDLGFYIDFPNKENQYIRKDILYFVAECEVVGNIHDNPELLEDRDE